MLIFFTLPANVQRSSNVPNISFDVCLKFGTDQLFPQMAIKVVIKVQQNLLFTGSFSASCLHHECSHWRLKKNGVQACLHVGQHFLSPMTSCDLIPGCEIHHQPLSTSSTILVYLSKVNFPACQF